MAFQIKYIEIYDDCSKSIRKILSPGVYPFLQEGGLSIYPSGITVSSIVGQNGSGKSSLLEIFFRIINNVGAILLRDIHIPMAEPLRYVLEIYADLAYEVDNRIYKVMVRNEEIGFVYDDHKIYFRLTPKRHHKDFIEFKKLNTVSVKLLNELTDKFFYAIVTNYSLQAYISSDYCDDKQRSSSRGRWTSTKGKPWINSLFHKNDGYLCPITLNPYRDKGVIDMVKEERLVKSRLVSILLEEGNWGFNFLQGYRLDRVLYKYQRIRVEGIIANCLEDDGIDGEESLEGMRNAMQTWSRIDGTYINVVSSKIGALDDKEEVLPVYWDTLFYVSYKILKIFRTYPIYNSYNRIRHLRVYSDKVLADEELKMLKHGIDVLLVDKTHVTVKLKQALHLLQHIDAIPRDIKLQRQFTYGDYEKWMGDENLKLSVSDRLQILPPSFFTPEIIFRRIDDDQSPLKVTEKTNRNVRLNYLSSGERQFLYTMSAVVYHLMNLLSIKEDERTKYKNYCVIFDEVEICFHPEYQRTFIAKMLYVLSHLLSGGENSVHVILTTHSPFVLSDIDKRNILYLEEGHIPKESRNYVNPFAANINDILKQSFFLKKGFAGDYAQEVINGMVDFMLGNPNAPMWTLENMYRVIDSIEEPFLKNQLRQVYSTYKNSVNQEAKDDRLLQIEAEIDRLQKEADTLKER